MLLCGSQEGEGGTVRGEFVGPADSDVPIPCLGLPRRRHLDPGNLVHTYFIQLQGSEMMFA